MALIKCKECGQMVSDKVEACPNCGCPIEKGLVCKECGSPISVTDAICLNCGCPIKRSRISLGWKKPIIAFVILLAIVGGAYGVWNFLNGTNKDIQITQELTDAVHRYDVVSSFHEGLSAVCKNQKWGYINSKGEEVIPCKYEYSCDFSEGLACVYLGGDDMPIAFIDKKGKVVIDGFFGDSAQGGGGYCQIIFKDGACMVYDKEGHLWINKEGQKINEPQHSESKIAEQTDYQIFYDNGKCGVKDSLGNIRVKAEYSDISDFSEGLARAYLYCGDEESMYGFIDKLGNTTFSQSDFDKLLAYEKQQQEKQKAEEEARRIAAMKPDWIQGTWVYPSSYGTSKVVINGDNIAVYIDGSLVYNGSYVIEDGNLVYNRHNGMSDYIILDSNSQRLKADETTYFNRVSSNSSKSNNDNSIYSTNILNIDNQQITF